MAGGDPTPRVPRTFGSAGAKEARLESWTLSQCTQPHSKSGPGRRVRGTDDGDQGNESVCRKEPGSREGPKDFGAGRAHTTPLMQRPGREQCA